MSGRTKTFKEIVGVYVEEVEKLRERKMCLGTGEKGTNIEVQLDKTIERFEKRIKSLQSLEGTKARRIL